MLNSICKNNYIKVLLFIAIPITFQNLLQSSMGIIDQIMVGSLGDVSISGIGLANRFSTIFFFTVNAIAISCGIQISQFYARSDNKNIGIVLKIGVIVSLFITLLFFVPSFFFSKWILKLYTNDLQVIEVGERYLKIVSFSFISNFIVMMYCSLSRSTGRTILPAVLGILSVFINTFLNYCLINGKLGFKAYGSDGAAYATLIASIIQMIIMIGAFIVYQLNKKYKIMFLSKIPLKSIKDFIRITIPLLICEFMWSLGESIYGGIYGHIGTVETSAITLIGPIVGLSVGLFGGVSQAASVMIGNRLGAGEDEMAYFLGKRFLLIGIIGSIVAGIVIILIANVYVNIYNISIKTKEITIKLLIAFSCVLWIKVSNMINGGILRSGGKTNLVMTLDLLGTWVFGVPLGLLFAFVFKFNVVYVYLIIAFEELVRLIIGFIMFKKRVWIKKI